MSKKPSLDLAEFIIFAKWTNIIDKNVTVEKIKELFVIAN